MYLHKEERELFHDVVLLTSQKMNVSEDIVEKDYYDYLIKTGELIICKDDPGEEHEFFRKAKDDDPDWNLDEIFGEDLEETDDSYFDSEEFLRIDSDRIINAVNQLAEKRVEMHNSSGYLDSVLFNVATATEVKEIMDNGGMYNPYTDTVVGR